MSAEPYHVAVDSAMSLVGFDYQVDEQRVTLEVEWRPVGSATTTSCRPAMSGGATLEAFEVLVELADEPLPSRIQTSCGVLRLRSLQALCVGLEPVLTATYTMRLPVVA